MLFSCLMLVETSCTSLRKSTCILSAVIIPSRSRAEVGLMLANSCPVLSHSIGTATLFIKDSTFICIRTFISETNTQINPAVPLGKLRCEGLGHFFSLLLAYKGGIHESKLLCVHGILHLCMRRGRSLYQVPACSTHVAGLLLSQPSCFCYELCRKTALWSLMRYLFYIWSLHLKLSDSPRKFWFSEISIFL